jgi:hypothetical protein
MEEARHASPNWRASITLFERSRRIPGTPGHAPRKPRRYTAKH